MKVVSSCVQLELTFTIQTFDGGYKWSVRTFGNLDEEEEINYRFQKVGAMCAVVKSLGVCSIRGCQECM